MIHFDCPHCKKAITVPDDAQGKQCRCPGCGQISRAVPKPIQLLSAAPADNVATHPATKRLTATQVVRAVFWLVVVGMVARASCSKSATEVASERAAAERADIEDKRSERKVAAWGIAQGIVEKGLRAPSTASYGGLFSGDFQDPNTTVSALWNNEYRVVGWVDSHNAFGAMVRTEFYLRLKDNGDGNWSVIGEPVIRSR